MSSHIGSLKRMLACSAIAGGLAVSAGFAFAAENVTSESIINALTPKRPLTRSLSVSPGPSRNAQDAETKKFVDTLRNRSTRSLTSNERDHIAMIARDKPKIDLEIRFDFNSANISRSAMPDVQALGKALADPSLKGNSFVLAGHTDAVGSEHANQDLSERRADSVKQYLVENYGLAPDRLVTAGYGKSRLKDKDHPTAALNRRVEIVNMDDK
jgi:outer membrane protein OmpA-like peptidoglycan-associated protein